jgi:hypothetical protein
VYTCDWPASGGVCGKQAWEFVDGGPHHRPVCRPHACVAAQNGAPIRDIEDIDPTMVPQKIPTQAERGWVDADGGRWVVREGVVAGATTGAQPPFVHNPIPPPKEPWVFQPLEPVDPPPSVAPPLSRPPLKEALAEVALAFLGFVKKKIEEETKR